MYLVTLRLQGWVHKLLQKPLRGLDSRLLKFFSRMTRRRLSAIDSRLYLREELHVHPTRLQIHPHFVCMYTPNSSTRTPFFCGYNE